MAVWHQAVTGVGCSPLAPDKNQPCSCRVKGLVDQQHSAADSAALNLFFVGWGWGGEDMY